MRHTDALQRFTHIFFALGCAEATVRQRQLDIFVHVQIADQVETLKDESDLSIANACAIREGKIGDFGAFERVAPVRRVIKKA